MVIPLKLVRETRKLTAATGPPWNTRLRELAKQGQFAQALILYRSMLRSGSSPDAFSFPFALKSCAYLSLSFAGKQLHAHVVRTGCDPEPFVLTSLISMYCRCGLVDDARKVFDENPTWSQLAVCYNALVSGYAANSRVLDAVMLFGRMREMGVSVNGVTMLGLLPAVAVPGYLPVGMCFHGCCVKVGLDVDTSVANCLVTMYVKCGSVEHGRILFDEMPEKDLITWNAMITGYAQNGFAAESLELYQKMNDNGVCPDPMTFVAVLSSCANLGAQSLGKKVEREIKSSGYVSNLFLNNALVNMYARCGNLLKAQEVFDGMPVKTVVSWTAIINGYGMHGEGEVSVQLFDEMINAGVMPDRTAFVSVLCACSHAGLVDKGLDYLTVMQKMFGLQPGPEHYSCVVDLLGRAGRLSDALEIINSMEVEPDGAVWGALLGASKIHRNIEVAELAFERVIECEPTNIGYYVLLSNIYSNARNVEGVLKIRNMMRQRKLKKEPGYSYVEYEGRVHLFLAGDRSNPQTEEIYRMLDELEVFVRELFGCQGIQEITNEEVLAGMGIHSEKLAVAFGLLNISQEREIIVMKNLRVCEDCHLFLKAVSKIASRELVVRDATRFHHFRDGLCTCKDYW